MNKTFGYVAASLGTLAILCGSAREASTQVQGSLPAFLKLQATTPGTAQSGHANITGTAIVGGFKLTTGAGSGKVLTSDSSGNATWQSGSGFSLPYAGSVDAPNSSVLSVTNTNVNTSGDTGLAGTAQDTGVLGTATGSLGYGVRGICLGTVGAGVKGTAPASAGSGIGIQGSSSGDHGYGVYGSASAFFGPTYAGYFLNYSDSGVGVSAVNTATSGFNFSGYFENSSSNGSGVYALNVATTGGANGGYFISGSPDARALYGLATAANGTSYGVVGQSNSASGGFGVWGTATANGYAVFGQGRLSATTKLFTIDHPLDPANKYLLHYCEEGPEPLNVYSGKVRTNNSGLATVSLPNYFTEINKDPRIQLTVEDASDEFVLVKTLEGVSNGQFRIRSSKPNTIVYWRVEGVRNDRWMQRYGAPVETIKPDAQRGLYLHPELYGKPKEMAINYNAAPPMVQRAQPSHP